MNTQLLTTSQAARELDLSVERVRQLAASGRLASIVTPLGRLFSPGEVERLAAERRQLRERSTAGES